MKLLIKLACVLVFGVSLLAGCHDSTSDDAASSSSVSTPGGTSSTTTSSATLSWQAPTTDTNGQPLMNLSGYVIYYGNNVSDLNQTIQLTSTGVQTYVVENLTSGTWYFAIRATTSSGAQSAMSDVVSKTIS